MVSCERLRLELEEVRSRRERPDPRLKRLEEENGRLRRELASVRAELERMELGVRRAVDHLEAAAER
ncbi:MAG: hypothetical protein J2P45_05330 [Candidatus Dormibacteraeota bacterium]|nr:hypothetical protein [Candidatus Dormibacteraeota bacterium]